MLRVTGTRTRPWSQPQFGVDALDPGVGKAVDQCGVDPRAMFADRSGELHERGQLRTRGPSEPGIQQRYAVDALELEDLPELLLSVNRPWRSRHATATVIPLRGSWRRDSEADE